MSTSGRRERDGGRSPQLGPRLRLPPRHHGHRQDLALFPLTEELEDGSHDRVTVRSRAQSAGCEFKAGGYVAMSRVRRDSDYLLGGLLEAEHFTPAL